MPSAPLYRHRRANGLCVRCGGKAKDGYVLCPVHRRMSQAYERSRTLWRADDAPGALSAARQPPVREPVHVKPPPVLPPLPTVCPKCAGGLVPCAIELYLRYEPAVRCMYCGYMTDRFMLQNRLGQLQGVAV